MLKYRKIVKASARRIANAANATIDELVAHRVEHEPDFTGEMLGRMKQAMHDYHVGGVSWTAKILTSHGSNAQERRFGADFMGVLTFDLPEYKVQKGFLAQAKRVEVSGGMSNGEWHRLTAQCKVMLSITNASYVFLYSSTGITIVPAVVVIAAQKPFNPHGFYTRKIVRFYEEHFECFVGDPQLSSADTKTLERIQAKRALLLSGTVE